jgi:hypothetical protein
MYLVYTSIDLFTHIYPQTFVIYTHLLKFDL